MKRKKRRRKQGNRIVSIGIIAIILVLLGSVGYPCAMLWEKNEDLKKVEAAKEKALQKEVERSEEIEELSKYVQTKQYAEEVAKEQLGMVYPDEIIFKADE